MARIPINCYPACSNSKIINNLTMINPCIDISILDIALVGTAFIEKMKEIVTYLEAAASRLENVDNSEYVSDNIETEIAKIENRYSNLGENDESHYFKNLYGFLSLLSTKVIATYNNIPIFDSPQIRVAAASGFKDSQPLFSFINSIISNGVLGYVFESTGADSIIKLATNTAESIGEWFGWSPQLSPFFSFKEMPFANKPAFNATIQLINDTKEAVVKNATFLSLMTKQSLIGSKDAKENGKESKALFHTWKPPLLFHVGLRYGAGSKSYVKKYHFCTLETTVKMEGIMRLYDKTDNGNAIRVPDIYTVNMNFQSILPDTLDTWLDAAFPYIDNTKIEDMNSKMSFNEQKFVDKSPIKPMTEEEAEEYAEAMEQAEMEQALDDGSYYSNMF